MIVGTEVVKYDRPSFHDWYPKHLENLLPLVDALYVRVGEPYEEVTKYLDDPKITWHPQFDHYGRFQEDAERQALLAWALQTGADWCVCFDADEVIEPGGAEALRACLEQANFRTAAVWLNYSSHHRPGYVITERTTMTWRAFRLDGHAASYVFQADEDGLHCGTVPQPFLKRKVIDDLYVVHYHATTCEEYMGERAFYDGTAEVAKHGGIDWLYRCDRFGSEDSAVPLEELLADHDERMERVRTSRL